MKINVNMYFFFFFTLCQNIVGLQTPFIKNWWHLKGDRLTFICVFSVQCTLHLFKKHYKTPNGGNNLQWNFVLMNLSKPGNLSKCPTVQLKKQKQKKWQEKSLIIRRKYASILPYSWAMTRKTQNSFSNSHWIKFTKKKKKIHKGAGRGDESTSAYIESLLEKLKNIFSLSYYLQLL